MNKTESFKYGKVAAGFLALVANSLPFVIVELKHHKTDTYSIGQTEASTLGILIVLISITAIVFTFLKKNWTKMGYAVCGVLNSLLMIGVATSATSSRKESLFVGFWLMLIACLAQAALGVIEALPDILKLTATSPAAAQQIAAQQPAVDPSAMPVAPVQQVPVQPVAPVVPVQPVAPAQPVQPMAPIDPSATQQ